jgi:hypothetical protein
MESDDLIEEEDDGAESLLYLSLGPLAAIVLGMALVPLRDFTVPSNFTFAFLVLTIAVAELGGRWAALATAFTSALSLDFFLTQPYLRLTIAEKHDAIAFLGLLACGLMAAFLGSRRRARFRTLVRARQHLHLLHSVLAQLEQAGPVEGRLAHVLATARANLPISAAVVRDGRGYVFAASERAYGRPIPDRVLEAALEAPAEPSLRRRLRRPRPPFPPEGARLPLVAGNRQVGWLDVWGNGEPATSDSRRALSDITRLVAALVAERP